MTEIQEKILRYVASSKYFSIALKFDVVLAVIYPVYLLLAKIPFLSSIWSYVGMVSSVFYIAYYIGTILCFAENKLIPLDIAFAGMTLNYLFNLQYGINFNRLVYIAFYGLILGVCIVGTRKSLQWDQFKAYTFSKVADVADVAGDKFTGNKANKLSFCPNCGAKLDKKMRFCNNCGAQIMKEE